ncbi:MAG: CHASE domain-containing protein [Betaproteobacteria bacterium]|nr:CHASE domain-containing protein [Betaproteobacteria bacterium]
MVARHRMAALRLLPWLALVGGLTISWLVWDYERQSARKELRARFDFALRETVSRVEQHMVAYEQMLRGVQALFATTGTMDRKAFHDYVGTLQPDANFSGVQALGIAKRVPSQLKAAHVATMRRLGFAGYEILPAGERELYAPVVQREPGIGRNRAPFGFDPWSDPVRRQAMEKARDSGMAAITGKVRLIIDSGTDAPPGFIMYLPIYAHGEMRDSVTRRRKHLVGWVYASFHVNDFMASLYGKQLPGLSLAIYDGVVPADGALLFRSADGAGRTAPALTANEYMVVAGHTWMLSMVTQPEFETGLGRDAASVIAVTGIGLSVLLALLVWLMLTGRTRALRLAAEMTEELRHMAQHDALTDLPTRALFSERLHRELARAKRHDGRFAMIFLDLDNFKPINDNFGHAVGDLLLQQVARRLQASVRVSDTIGRIGGDEFVVLLPELTGAGTALVLAEKIRQAVRHPFIVDGRKLSITCSLGVAIYPDDGADEIVLTKSADEAMYRAKESGRDSVRLAG